MENIFQLTLERHTMRMEVNGILINNRLYNTTILAKNIQKLQTLNANEVRKVYDLNINMSKTKLMIVSRHALMMQFFI